MILACFRRELLNTFFKVDSLCSMFDVKDTLPLATDSRNRSAGNLGAFPRFQADSLEKLG